MAVQMFQKVNGPVPEMLEMMKEVFCDRSFDNFILASTGCFSTICFQGNVAKDHL